MGASGANLGDDAAAAVAERRWAMVSTAVIAYILAIVAFTSMHWATMPTSAIEPIDPTTLHVAGEFVEQNLGPRIGGDGAVIVRLIAQQYSFNPQCMFTFLRGLEPVRQPNRENELRFPYNNRSLMFGWRALYFTEGTFTPVAGRTAQLNRGAYLVEGLGHCASCHSAINALGGSSEDSAFAGGLIPLQNWYAPSLTSNQESGLGNWSITEIAALLEDGASMRGAVYGPMAEVTHDSLQYLTPADGAAMAVYLKSLLESKTDSRRQEPVSVPAVLAASGRAVYERRCAACHRSDGRGMPPAYPPLAGNPSIEMESSVNPLRMVLNGGYPPQTAANPRPYGMPPFAQVLSDDEVAAVVTYIRVSWHNHGSTVTRLEANAMRAAPLLD